MNFKQLHQQESPLLLCNVWDVASAATAEKLGFQAIGTSSAAIAKSLGYDDGESMSFDELFATVKRISLHTTLPLTVDIEAGYSRDHKLIVEHIVRLSELGIVGINIEDSIVDGNRELVNADEFASLLEQISTALSRNNVNVFINARTDTYILGVENGLQETIDRANLYCQAGANGIFVPCITNENEIEQLVKCVSTPINVMCMPELPDFEQLKNLGVKRISMGNFLFENLNNHFESLLDGIIKKQSFELIC